MKRYTSFLHFILLQVVIMMTSCSPDDTYTDNLTTKPGAAKPLCISVNRTDFLSDSKNAETRTTHDDAFAASFKNDDRIGIIGISGGTVVFNNLEYKYNNGTWEAVGDICYAQDDMTYIAYYPYSTAMNGKKSEAEILNAFTVPTDQKSPKDENDLMAATVKVTTREEQITFSMKHLLCLLVLQTPTYLYKWDNVEIPVALEKNNIKSDKFTCNGTEYSIDSNTKYLLVKPGSNITIKSKREVDRNKTFSCQKTGISTTANNRYNVNLKYKWDGANIEVKVKDHFYKTASNFGFPCPQEWKNVPNGCIKIGTVAKMGREFEAAKDDYNVSLTDTATDIQTYTTINNTPLGTPRGYIASNYICPLGVLFDKDQNKTPNIERTKVQGFTYTYQYCTNSKPYENYLKTKANHPTNTSKWFIPGVAEARAILYNILPDDSTIQYWTCDRSNSKTTHNYYYRHRGIFMEIADVEYYSEYCHTIFMLAF